MGRYVEVLLPEMAFEKLGLLLSLVVGLSIGSYLACLIYRFPRKIASTQKRSFCPHCKRNLAWQDLIPALSFIFLQGHCRFCKGKISAFYPSVELSTAGLFVVIWFIFKENLFLTIYLWAIVSTLLVTALIDLRHFLIFDKVLLTGGVIFSVFHLADIFFIHSFTSLSSVCARLSCSLSGSILAMALFSGLLGLMFFISSGKWLGFGDVKLAALAGLVIGFPGIINIFYLSFFSGAIAGLILLSAGLANRKSRLPLGTFIAGSAILYLLYPINILVRLYL